MVPSLHLSFNIFSLNDYICIQQGHIFAFNIKNHRRGLI